MCHCHRSSPPRRDSLDPSARSAHRRWATPLVLLLVTTLAGCVQPSPYDHVDGPTATRFQQYVDDFAHPRMDGRGAGHPGLDRARDALVDHFTALGLAPAFVDDAGQPSFTQSVAIQLGAQARKQTLRVSVDAYDGPAIPGDALGGAAHSFGPGSAFNALGFSGQGTFAGEAIFVGYGITAPERDYDSYGDLAGEDALAGKVAIAFRYEPVDARGRSRWAGEDGRAGRFSESASLLRKAEQAAARGAAALLVVDPPALASAGPLRTTASTDLGDRPAAIPVMHIRLSTLHVMLRAAGRDPHAAVDTWQARANRGVDRPDVLNRVRLAGEVRIEYPHATVHNVAGYLPGTGDLARETVVIGAHYDHLGYGEIGSFADPDAGPTLHPGADDNASGTAAVMLLAERAVARADESGEDDRRSLLFVGFSGEERGLLGSMHMVEQADALAVDFDAIVAMVNLDMVGRLAGELLVFGEGSGDRWAELLADANAPLGLNVRHGGLGVGMSDHTAFYLQRLPVLHFFTGIHDDYHRPSDTPDRVNAPGGALVVQLVDRLVHRLARLPDRLAFTGETDPHASAAMYDHGRDDTQGLGRARLGIMPDYATREGDRGVGVAGVSPGSPAEAAGLKAGDRIRRWNDQPVPTVRALTRHLRDAEPGDIVRLHIDRNGDRPTLEVTLGRR